MAKGQYSINNIDPEQLTISQAEDILFWGNHDNNDKQYIIITEESLKKAYRAMAVKYHPDSNPTKEKEATLAQKFVNSAYTILREQAIGKKIWNPKLKREEQARKAREEQARKAREELKAIYKLFEKEEYYNTLLQIKQKLENSDANIQVIIIGHIKKFIQEMKVIFESKCNTEGIVKNECEIILEKLIEYYLQFWIQLLNKQRSPSYYVIEEKIRSMFKDFLDQINIMIKTDLLRNEEMSDIKNISGSDPDVERIIINTVRYANRPIIHKVFINICKSKMISLDILGNDFTSKSILEIQAADLQAIMNSVKSSKEINGKSENEPNIE